MNTIIGKDTTFTGTIDVKGPLKVDGVVKGKIISSDEVHIGPTGMVEAQIEAKSAIVSGRMMGNIVASERIELLAKSDVEGDLRTKSLVIEQGAIFCGGCHMKDGKSSMGFIPPDEKTQTAAPASSSSSQTSIPIGSAGSGGGSSFGFAVKSDQAKEKART